MEFNWNITESRANWGHMNAPASTLCVWNKYLVSYSNIIYEMESFFESFVFKFLYKTDFSGTWNLLLRLTYFFKCVYTMNNVLHDKIPHTVKYTMLTYIYIDIKPCTWMHAKPDIQINVFRIQTQLGHNQNSLCGR